MHKCQHIDVYWLCIIPVVFLTYVKMFISLLISILQESLPNEVDWAGLDLYISSIKLLDSVLKSSDTLLKKLTYMETSTDSLSVWIYQLMWNCFSYLKSFSRIITGCLMLPGSRSPACCESAVITPELCGEIFPLTEIIKPKLQFLTAQTVIILYPLCTHNNKPW
jgi:hypothetical protein